MAQTVEQRFGPRLRSRFVVVKDGHLRRPDGLSWRRPATLFPITLVSGQPPGSVPWRQHSVGAIS